MESSGSGSASGGKTAAVAPKLWARSCTCRKGDALAALGKLLQPINVEAVKPVERRWTLTELIDEAYLPYCRRKWKESTAETTEDRIQYHIVRDLGKMEIRNINRDMLQRYLERKTKEGLSHSVVHHLRWDLRAILRFAFQDGLVDLNAGESLFRKSRVSG